MIGAHLLREHHRLPAVPVSGAAFYSLVDGLDPLAFAEQRNGRVGAGLDGFHSWIGCKDFVIDFSAPLFRENVAELNPNADIPRRAFIKPLSLMSERLPQKGDREGTFLLIPDETCTANMVNTFHTHHLSTDLQAICTAWYRRPPKKMEMSPGIRDQHGKMTFPKRKDIGIRGFW
jgi:Protein of unknown function (DUF2026)